MREMPGVHIDQNRCSHKSECALCSVHRLTTNKGEQISLNSSSFLSLVSPFFVGLEAKVYNTGEEHIFEFARIGEVADANNL